MPPTDWEIYHRQMYSLGYGKPLYEPEPQSADRRLEIGSVVYHVKEMKDRVVQLLNTAQDPQHPANQKGVPLGFEQFSISKVLGPWPAIKQEVLCSKTVKGNGGELRAGASIPGAPLGAEAGVKFKISGNTGAFLVLKHPAIQRVCRSKRPIVTYMRAHFDSWLELANTVHEESLTPHDLFFVSGTTMTTKWAITAFEDAHYREKEIDLQVSIADAVTVKTAWSHERGEETGLVWNYGPSMGTEPDPPRVVKLESESKEEVEGNQCVFLNYYKMKRRIWWHMSIRAGAGPHELPPADEDGRSESPVRAYTPVSDDSSDEDRPGRNGLFDPVDVLLDYIFEQSHADIAIASDRDLTALFRHTELPMEPQPLKDALAQMQPPIDVDEEGVGTITVDMSVLDPEYPGTQAQKAEAEEDGEQVAAPEETTEDVQVLEPALDDPQVGQSQPRAHDAGDEESKLRQPIIWEPAPNGHTGSVTAFEVSPDSRWVASGSDDTTVILWDRDEQTVVRKWESHGDTVWDLAFSPDSRRLASAGEDKRIVVWDIEEGVELAVLEGHTDTIHSIVWAPDGKRLASGSDDTTARVWSMETYEAEYTLEGHHAMVTFVVFSPDGRYLATGGADYTCRLWNVEDGTMLHALRGHRGMMWTAAFDPECRRVATASDDGTVRIWRVESGEELLILHEHHGPVWSVAFSSDGKQLLSGSSDSTALVCDSYSGERLLAIRGHDSMVNAAMFSPDGKYIATASSDNTVRLWKRRSGEAVRTFNEHNDKVTHAVFSPDGLTLASGSDDGTVRIRALREYVPDDAETAAAASASM